MAKFSLVKGDIHYFHLNIPSNTCSLAQGATSSTAQFLLSLVLSLFVVNIAPSSFLNRVKEKKKKTLCSEHLAALRRAPGGKIKCIVNPWTHLNTSLLWSSAR